MQIFHAAEDTVQIIAFQQIDTRITKQQPAFPVKYIHAVVAFILFTDKVRSEIRHFAEHTVIYKLSLTAGGFKRERFAESFEHDHSFYSGNFRRVNIADAFRTVGDIADPVKAAPHTVLRIIDAVLYRPR